MRRSLADVEWLDAGRWRRSAAALAQREDALRWTVRHLAEVRVRLDGEIVLPRLADEPDRIARRLLLDCILRIDPDARPRGEEVTRLLTRVRSARERSGGVAATLASVLVSAREEARGLLIRFDRAPPRGWA